MKSDAASRPEELSGSRTIADIALSRELTQIYTLFNTYTVVVEYLLIVINKLTCSI